MSDGSTARRADPGRRLDVRRAEDFVMNRPTRLLCGLCALLLLITSCGKRPPKVRDKSFLATEEPIKVSDLVYPGLTLNSQGALRMTAFHYSRIPSATEAHDAIAVFESEGEDRTAWAQVATVPSFGTYGVWGYDLAADKQGRLFLTWVAGVYPADNPQPFKAILFSRSDDGGRVWTDPVYVSDVATGQRRNPAMAVKGGDVYIAWLDPRGHQPGAASAITREDVYFASSADHGATWTSNVCIETDLDRKEGGSGTPSLCVGGDGAVYCAFFSIRRYERTEGGFWIAKSTDRGRNFSVALQNVGPLGDICLLEENGRLHLATVYIKAIKSFSMDNPQTSQEIRFYTSSNGGEKWSKHVLIDDDPNHRRKSNLRLFSLGAGKLAACWDDERGGVTMAASTDGGESWGKNVQVAAKSSVGITPLDVAADASSGVFYLAASDVRKGDGDATYLVKGTIVP